MSKSEQTMQRIYFLRQFDEYVRDTIGDDDITEYWLAFGMPDGSADDIDVLEEIAEDDNLWLGCVKAFAHCIDAESEFDEE